MKTFFKGAFATLALALPFTGATAATIPIEEEFVLAQQLHAEFAIQNIYLALDSAGWDIEASSWSYAGGYEYEDIGGVITGSYSGLLTGSFLGKTWEVELGSTATSLSPLTFNLSSKGKWELGDYAGKTYTDTGTLLEKADNTADLDLTVTTAGVAKTDTFKMVGMKKKKDEKKKTLTATGKAEVPYKGKTKTASVKLVLKQDTKTFTSLMTVWGATVTENTGTYTIKEDGDKKVGMTYIDFDVAPVPVPGSGVLMAGGLAGLVLLRRRRKAA